MGAMNPRSVGLRGQSKRARTFFSQPSRAVDGDDRIIYATDTGVLRYDPDGAGGAGATVIAILTGKPDLTAGDFLIVA